MAGSFYDNYDSKSLAKLWVTQLRVIPACDRANHFMGRVALGVDIGKIRVIADTIASAFFRAHEKSNATFISNDDEIIIKTSAWELKLRTEEGALRCDCYGMPIDQIFCRRSMLQLIDSGDYSKPDINLTSVILNAFENHEKAVVDQSRLANKNNTISKSA